MSDSTLADIFFNLAAIQAILKKQVRLVSALAIIREQFGPERANAVLNLLKAGETTA